jgi:lysophospholipase L1-like esterase
MRTKVRYVLVLILWSILVTIISVGSLEIAARYIWHKKYNEWLTGQLHGYDRVDSHRSIIVPIPNTAMTVARYREELTFHQKPLGMNYLKRSLADELLPDSAVLFTINQYGYKGPEFNLPKPPNTIRILAIGDSCTWGPPDDRFSYPRILEKELNMRVTDKDAVVEVINAGVPGSSLEKAAKRIDEFKDTDPDIVTIFLGWNGTIGRADPDKISSLYRYSALYKVFYHLIQNRSDTGLSEPSRPKTYYDDSLSAAYHEIDFESDLMDLDFLVRSFQQNSNIRIVLITLAGLFDWRVEPDEKSLQFAYPISSTNNLYAYAILTKKFNQVLRDYSRANGLSLIDFEEYAWKALRPRSDFFHDSVHPNLRGYREMGIYFSSELLPLVNQIRQSSINAH